MGICFSSVMDTPPLSIAVSVKNTRSAFIHRLSLTSSVTGTLQSRESHPVPRSTVTVSHRLMRCITEVIS